MSLSFERMEWMPSPPLAPDDGPIDMAHLERMTLGDHGLQQEVLAMFSAQTAELTGWLADLPDNSAALAHTLKGSARAIGAFGVAEAAANLETAMDHGDPVQALAILKAAIAEAGIAIDAILNRS